VGTMEVCLLHHDAQLEKQDPSPNLLVYELDFRPRFNKILSKYYISHDYIFQTFCWYNLRYNMSRVPKGWHKPYVGWYVSVQYTVQTGTFSAARRISSGIYEDSKSDFARLSRLMFSTPFQKPSLKSLCSTSLTL